MPWLSQQLNFHLGALAAAEDRPAIYPKVDFCTQPDSICTEDSMEMRFVVGMFEWVSSVSHLLTLAHCCISPFCVSLYRLIECKTTMTLSMNGRTKTSCTNSSIPDSMMMCSSMQCQTLLLEDVTNRSILNAQAQQCQSKLTGFSTALNEECISRIS